MRCVSTRFPADVAHWQSHADTLAFGLVGANAVDGMEHTRQ